MKIEVERTDKNKRNKRMMKYYQQKMCIRDRDSTLLDAEPDESVEEKEKSSRVLER